MTEQQREDRRLKSWKEIAAFLGCDERTAKRWETSRGLPVRRLQAGPRSGVFAFTSELEAWLGEAPMPPVAEFGSSPFSPSSSLSETRPDRPNWIYRGGSLLGILFVIAVTAIVATQSSHREPSLARHVPDARAQAFYRTGLEDWQLRTPASLTRAIDEFTQAIVHDPQYALAYSGLANCYNLLREYTPMPGSYAFPRAKAAAERAVALDPSLADAHAALAFVDFYWSYDTASARREFSRALQLAPSNPTVHHWYATVLAMQRNFSEALSEIESAQQLDPESLSIQADKALILFHAGRGREAMVQLLQIEQAAPQFASVHLYLAAIDDSVGDNEGYLRELEAAADARRDTQYRAIVEAGAAGLASGGRSEMFRAMLKLIEQRFKEGNGGAYPIALLYADLGNTDEALKYLKLSLERRETEAVALNVDSSFGKIRNEAAFRNLSREFGFES